MVQNLERERSHDQINKKRKARENLSRQCSYNIAKLIGELKHIESEVMAQSGT